MSILSYFFAGLGFLTLYYLFRMIIESRRFDKRRVALRFALFAPGQLPALVLPTIPFINPFRRGKAFLDIVAIMDAEEKDDLVIIAPLGTVVFTRNAKTAKEAFVGLKEAVKKPVQIYVPFLGLFGPNVVITEGSEWLRHRLVVQPIFSDANLRFMADCTADELNKLVKKWETTPEIEVGKEITRVTLSVVCRSVFGIEFVEENGRALELTGVPLEEIFKVVSENTVIRAVVPNFIYRILPLDVLRKTKRAFDAFELYSTDLIERRRREGSSDRRDLLSLLIQANSVDAKHALSSREILADVFVLMFAGHETTATALTWALILLAFHPEEQHKIRSEIMEVIADGRAPIYEDYPRLIRSRAALQEAMRIFPPVVHIPRVAVQKCIINGIPFTPDQRVSISAFGLHRNPKIWPQPLTFRPDRFDERVSPPVDDYHWITFARGPSACIGSRFSLIEGTLILAMLLKRLKIEPPAGLEEDALEGVISITLKPVPQPTLLVKPLTSPTLW